VKTHRKMIMSRQYRDTSGRSARGLPLTDRIMKYSIFDFGVTIDIILLMLFASVVIDGWGLIKFLSYNVQEKQDYAYEIVRIGKILLYAAGAAILIYVTAVGGYDIVTSVILAGIAALLIIDAVILTVIKVRYRK